MKIEGKAHLVTDPEEINELSFFPESIKEKARNQEVLVKMKVANIAYYEIQRKKRISWFKKIITSLNDLLVTRRPGYRLYRLEPDPGF